MFIRFVLLEVDDESSRKKGILVAAHDLRDQEVLTQVDQTRLETLLTWFNTHLRIPAQLSSEGNHRAISWFKSSAKKPIARMWELTHLLRGQGFVVELLKTDDPGSVLYEDKWQIVAKPARGRRIPW